MLKSIFTGIQVLLIAGVCLGQGLEFEPPGTREIKHYREPFTNQDELGKKASCGADTVFFTLLRRSGIGGLTLNGEFSTAVAQGFPKPTGATNVKLHGFYFLAAQVDDTLKSTTVGCSVWGVSNDTPSTGLLASKNVTVKGSSSYNFHKVEFANPVSITDDFFLSVKMFDTLNVNFAVNNYTQGDGQGDYFAAVKFGTPPVWNNGYDVFLSGYRFDADILMAPIISYDIDMNISDTLCAKRGIAKFELEQTPLMALNRIYDREALIATLTSNYSYIDSNLHWSTGFGDSEYGLSQRNFNWSNETGSNYSVTATMNIGYLNVCTITDTKSGQLFTADLNIDHAQCDPKGLVDVNATNGSAPYYYWYGWRQIPMWVASDTQSAPIGIHNLWVQDQYGCELQVSAEVEDRRLDYLLSGETYLCDQELTFVNFEVMGGSGTGYQLNFNNQGYSADTIYRNLGPGTYNVKVRDSEGCIKDSTVIIEKSTYSVTLTADNTVIETGQSVNFDVSASQASNCTYDFGDGSAVVNSCGDVSHKFNQDGTYEVVFTGKSFPDGCDLTESLTIQVGDGVGIGEENMKVFNIYPNPAEDIITIELNRNFSSYSLEIISSDGKVQRMEGQHDNGVISLDVSELRAGIYMIRLSSRGLVAYRRFIKN